MATLLKIQTFLSTQMIWKEEMSIWLGTCGETTSHHNKEALSLERKEFQFSLWNLV